MKLKLSIPESPMPVYYWAKFMGLAPFTMKNHRFHPPTLVEKLYPITVAIAYLFYVATFMTQKIQKLPSESTKKHPLRFWALAEIYTGFTTTCLTLIIFVLSYEKILTLMNNLCNMSSEFKTLGIDEECGKLFKNNLVATVTTNVVFTALCVGVYPLDPLWDNAQLAEYGIGRIFTINIFLVYARVLICIRQRFRLLNERLMTVLDPAQRVGSLHYSHTFATSQRFREKNQRDDIRKIEALHLELCDIVDRTNDLFNIPILLNAHELFGTFTLSCHWIYMIVVKSSSPCSMKGTMLFQMSPIFGPLVRIILMFLETLIIADASSTVCEQGNATQIALFKVWKKFKPVGLKNEFAMFSVQMMHKPVVVSVLGLFNLNYAYIYKIICTGVADTIILIQLEVPLLCP